MTPRLRESFLRWWVGPRLCDSCAARGNIVLTAHLDSFVGPCVRCGQLCVRRAWTLRGRVVQETVQVIHNHWPWR